MPVALQSIILDFSTSIRFTTRKLSISIPPPPDQPGSQSMQAPSPSSDRPFGCHRTFTRGGAVSSSWKQTGEGRVWTHLVAFFSFATTILVCGGGSAQDGIQRAEATWSAVETSIDASPVWEIAFDGQPVTTYRADLKGTPGFYPIYSPNSLPLTRGFPVEPAGPFEKSDHDHHRSMWFNHGIVNGLDFWVDDPRPGVGQIVHRSGAAQQSGDSLTLITQNDWKDAEGTRVLKDERTFRFSRSEGDWVIDVTLKMIASDGDVVFGDTKEGSFGVRVAGTMKVDSKMGGRIVNAEGLQDGETWAKRSDWVDYSGPAPKPEQHSDAPENWPHAGITMMYHPENSLPDCRWHVRSYGLFAANPFGRHHFGLPKYEGVKIPEGESLTIDLRVVLHEGEFDQEKTKRHFADYTR